jgi:hypothetical protein
MKFDELEKEIFDDYYAKHREILMDTETNSQQKADAILSKYDLCGLKKEQVKKLKDSIVKKEVDFFMAFVKENEKVLNSSLSHKEKLDILLEKYSWDGISTNEKNTLRNIISRQIHDNEVSKILEKLAKDLKIIQ